MMCIITAVTNVHQLYDIKPTDYAIHVCPGRDHDTQRAEGSALAPEPLTNEYDVDVPTCRCMCFISTSFALLISPK